MATSDPTARGRWRTIVNQALPHTRSVSTQNVHIIGPFDNAGYRGLLSSFPPEDELDLNAQYAAKYGDITWRKMDELHGSLEDPASMVDWAPDVQWSVFYLYLEIEVDQAQIAEFTLRSTAIVTAWINGHQMLFPTIPRPADSHGQMTNLIVALKPGKNVIMLKVHTGDYPWSLSWSVDSFGAPDLVANTIEKLIDDAPDDLIRLLARYMFIEVCAVQEDGERTVHALTQLREDPYATQWDIAWANTVEQLPNLTGSYLPLHDVPIPYQPVTDIKPFETFWPQSPAPAKDLLVVDVSDCTPQEEFALGVLQGLVNREHPRLYLLHTRYVRQDRTWLDELHLSGYTFREISISDAWDRFRDELAGAVLYDGSIMEEIGDYHSDRLNQTNVLMMIGALENAVPLTPEMHAELALPLVFDAQGRWSSQYDMMRWAYVELFPRMDHRILATNYPGIFLLTDYLVAHKIFTFWFPQDRTLPEEILLRGILASTPPNSPIVGWWFDWMPNPKDPDLRHADAVMETPGLLLGSYFGKVLTPSHEATNLTIHSGVAIQPNQHKAPYTPELDDSKVYYTHIISDGDNLGEALMMRTRDLQWDKPERGSIPMGWSFAPAAARMAPPVLNYYLRTASANDLLVGGLGVGYTEPIIYLRAYPEQREALYAEYARMTDAALSWIDTTCLWLINGGDAEEDRYARGSSGQLQGIFTGYGGSPKAACARMASNDVVAFRSASSFTEGKPDEELIETMVSEIRQAAGDTRPVFIEAWVLNWAWRMDMLQEVQRRLGDEFVCVRPDVLVKLRQQHAE